MKYLIFVFFISSVFAEEKLTGNYPVYKNQAQQILEAQQAFIAHLVAQGKPIPPMGSKAYHDELMKFYEQKQASDFDQCTKTPSEEIICPEGTYTFVPNGPKKINENIEKDLSKAQAKSKPQTSAASKQ